MSFRTFSWVTTNDYVTCAKLIFSIEKKIILWRTCYNIMQGPFFGVRIRFLASEGGSLHKYTNQS
jgi:hypothetical protein